MADSKRQMKYAKLIQRDLGDIFIRKGKSLLGNAFVTISGIQMSPDLGLAKVYVSVMMVNDKNRFIEQMNVNKPEFRRLLGNKIGKQVRAIPDLVFYLDDSLDQLDRVDQVFKGLNFGENEEKDNSHQ